MQGFKPINTAAMTERNVRDIQNQSKDFIALNKTKFMKKGEGMRSMAKMDDVSKPKKASYNDPLQ